jgi:transcriptional regulator with XRE-family HTH domain
MDYAKEIGRRLREARKDRGWSLEDVERQTGGAVPLKNLSRYERGERMLRHEEAVILAKTLGKRLAYLMAVDDTQVVITSLEEKLIKNWRTLAERDRMKFFRQIDAMAMASRDPIPDSALTHLSAKGKTTPPVRTGK